MVLARLRHSVDYPGQLASLPVVPVVVEELGDGDGDEAGQDPTQGFQNCLPLLRFLRAGAENAGADLREL